MTDSSDDKRIQRYAMYGYAGLVGTGFVFGMFNGFGNWIDWVETRNRITLLSSSRYINNLIDPIVNVGKDIGYLAWHTVTSGTLSALVVGTFPVTVPALAYFSKEKSS